MKRYRIVDDPVVARGYVLLDEKSTEVRSGKNPRKLSEWAFDNGADEVRHDEDLIKAEEFSWTMIPEHKATK